MRDKLLLQTMWDQREDWEQLETAVLVQKKLWILSLQTVPLVVFTLVLPHMLPALLLQLYAWLAVWRGASAWDITQYNQHQDSSATSHPCLALPCTFAQSLKMCRSAMFRLWAFAFPKSFRPALFLQRCEQQKVHGISIHLRIHQSIYYCLSVSWCGQQSSSNVQTLLSPAISSSSYVVTLKSSQASPVCPRPPLVWHAQNISSRRWTGGMLVESLNHLN